MAETNENSPNRESAVKDALSILDQMWMGSGAGSRQSHLIFASFLDAATNGNWTAAEVIAATEKLERQRGGKVKITFESDKR